MKKKLFLAALAVVALASCSDDNFVGNNSPDQIVQADTDAIVFTSNTKAITRAGELIGATAAEKLGGMFVVEGTKGTEAADAPSSDVVFDNYLVGYTANTAGTKESNTNNWEYVGLQSGITERMTAATWGGLHSGVTVQSIKYWDYSQAQYDFIAWSTGTCEAIATGDVASGKVKVTRINTGTDLSSTATGKGGFTLSAADANDLMKCYYTDIITVLKADYGKPVTLTFRNMAAKVRVALYETVPGYSVKDVKFYSSDANPTAPDDLGTGSSAANAVLFTMGTGNELPQSGDILVYYPSIGTNKSTAVDYKKASVTVNPGSTKSSTQTFGALSKYVDKEISEATGNYLGRNLPAATYAGLAENDYYTAVFPNTDGKPLTLRLDYTLVSTDGSGEEINVYGAKAVVPATYTVWQPNFAYTYIFKISDNSNGFTSQTYTDPKGLFPITFDAVVTSFTEANTEQTTITTVATPSITTYQQGHDHAHKDEYSKSQTAGVSTDVKDLYVQVMNNSGATPTLVADLNTAGKSLLFKVNKTNASEAEVMDALQNRTTPLTYTSVIGRNSLSLISNTNIDNTVTEIINGVDDQPITKIAGTAIAAGQVAKIDIDQLTKGTYAYVYATTVPTDYEKIYNVAADATDDESAAKYYEIAPSSITANPCAAGAKAEAGKVYFVKNVDANGDFVSWTFKQTKVGDDVAGLHYVSIPANKATSYTSGNFYFDVYNKNNGAYAVKVIKVVD